jgi:1-phosphofructokinase
VPRVLTLTLNPAIDMRMRFGRLQPEGLNRAQEVQLEPSGKGINVARALARQGVDVTAIALLGGPFGAMLEAQLLEQSISGQSISGQSISGQSISGQSISSQSTLRLLRVPIAGKTRCNVKVLDLEHSAVTELNAPGPAVSQAELENLMRTVKLEVRTGDLVVLSGSLPTGVPLETYAKLIRECSNLGAKTYLDADGAALQFGLEAKPFLIKPNRLEAETLLELKIDSRAAALEAASRFQALGAEQVVLSLGADGALFVSGSETIFTQPPTVKVHSTVGSGDAMLSGVVAAQTTGLSWTETARYATAVAAARVASSSLEFPAAHEIAALLGQVQCSAVT